MLKTGLLMVPQGGCILLNSFLNSGWGNCGWGLWVFRSFLHRLHRWKRAQIRKRVSEDYQSTILKITGRSGLYGTCQWILREDLKNMTVLHKICATVTLWWAEAANIFGCSKHGCGLPLSLFTWFGLWFLCDSRNEVATVRALFPGHSWYSGTTADRPTCDSKSQFQWYFQQW